MTKLVKGFSFAAAVALLVVGVSVSAQTTTFTRDLTIGATGADVIALQDILVAGGYLTMPAGVSRGYFGALTASAVKAWQAKVMLPATGYFGPMSRAAIAGSTTGTGSTGSTSELEGGDGDITVDQINSVSGENLDEGSSEQVLGFEVGADDSDVKVERVNVLFSTTTEEKPWKFFEEVALYAGDDKIADVDASDSDEWDEQSTDGVYEISFSGLKEVVKDGDTTGFYVEVTSKDSIDDTDLPVEWTIQLDKDGVRALNAEGINVYGPSATNGFDTTFDQDVADSSTLDFTFKASENEEQTVEVEDTTNLTEGVLLYTITAEATDGDINMDEITVTIGTTTGTDETVEEIVKSVYLNIDGDEVAKEAGDTSVTFEDLDYDLSEEDKVTIEVYADIEGTDDGDQFTTGAGVVVGSLAVDYVDSQDDDQTATHNTDGGDVSFYTQGVSAGFSSQSAVATYGSYSGDNDRAVFTITFKVTAFGEDDIYVGGANTTTEANAGITYTISSSTAGTITKAELTSNAEEGDNDTYVVSAGDTETFTFEVEVSDASTTAADVAQKVTITGIKWDIDDDATPDETYDDNLDDFKTASKTI